MLPDEDQLLHAVAVGVVPVAAEGGLAVHEGCQLVGGHGGKPLACIAQLYLLASLLEDVAVVVFVLEVANALHTNDIFRHLARHELIETMKPTPRLDIPSCKRVRPLEDYEVDRLRV